VNKAAADLPLPCAGSCGVCPEPEEVDKTGAYFVARCIEASCTVVDVRDDYAECNSGEDCVLRDGNDCCEDCDGSGYIALSSFSFVSELACPEILCSACATPPPAGLWAACNLDTHRCEKVQN
jgi:hypothetical protein